MGWASPHWQEVVRQRVSVALWRGNVWLVLGAAQRRRHRLTSNPDMWYVDDNPPPNVPGSTTTAVAPIEGSRMLHTNRAQAHQREVRAIQSRIAAQRDIARHNAEREVILADLENTAALIRNTRQAAIDAIPQSAAVVATRASPAAVTRPLTQRASPTVNHPEVAERSTAPVNSVAAQLTLAIDMPDAARLPAFRNSFRTDVAARLGVVADNVIITSVVAGSVIVDFYIAPAEDGSALVEADDVTVAFVAGVSVAGATLTANSMTSAPVVTAATDANEAIRFYLNQIT